MKKFLLNFNGRLLGAIGVFQTFNVTIEATNEKEAIKKLYDTHQDIGHLSVNGERYDVAGEPIY